MKVKRVVLAEYFTTEDATLLFIVREDFKEPLVKEINLTREDISQLVAEHFGVTEKVRNPKEDEWQQQLGQLVEPILPYADESDIIWLVPHDALHYLPL